MSLLQLWWEETYPKAAVQNVKNVSEGVLTNEDMYSFETWMLTNYLTVKKTKQMTDPNDPITPITPTPYENSDGNIQHGVYLGLSKREYFAAIAMQVLLTRLPITHNRATDLGIIESDRIAEESAIMADKLIKSLNA